MAPRGHSADDVARTALRILDDHGLPDLTMRRLATALEVQPSALYWHFPNKQTLLAELSDRIVARMASGAATDLRTEAHALRDALLAFRDGAEVVSSTLALGLGAPLANDRLTAAVVAEGFDVETASRVATTVLHYVLGFAWHEQQRLQYDSVGVHGGGGSAGAGPVGGGAVGAGSGGAGLDSAGSSGAGLDSAGSSGAGSGGAGSGGAGSGGAGSGGAGSGGAGTTGAGPADVMPADAGSTGVSTTDDGRAGRTGAGGVGATGGDPVGLATDDFAFGLDLIAAGLRARGRV